MTDPGVLTDILGSLVNAFSLKYNSIHGYASSLLRILILIELTFFGIYTAIDGGDVVRSLFKKILVIGAFQFLVSNYASLVDVLKDSFVGVGLSGPTGPGQLTLSTFLDPSAIISYGFTVVGPVWDNAVFTLLDGQVFTILMNLAVSVCIMASFIWIGMQIFMVLVEFYIVTTLAVIMIPFGIFKPTAFLADRAFGSIFAICIKMMVLAFVASAALPMVQGLSYVDALPTFSQSLTLFIGVLAVALIMAKAPSIAVSMTTGSAGLDASSGIMQPAMAALGAAGLAARALGHLPTPGGSGSSPIKSAAAKAASLTKSSAGSA